jgi:predicted DNA-binding transcriptional regulator YafY
MAVEEPRSPDGDGWVTMNVRFDDEDQACFLVLAQGARVDVIQPLSLRQRVAGELAAALERVRRLETASLEAHA